MSSPIVCSFQPLSLGSIIARLVLPQADGNAAVRWYCFRSGLVSVRMSMCSAIQPSSFASFEAMRSAKHFLPRRAFPP